MSSLCCISSCRGAVLEGFEMLSGAATTSDTMHKNLNWLTHETQHISGSRSIRHCAARKASYEDTNLSAERVIFEMLMRPMHRCNLVRMICLASSNFSAGLKTS